MPAVLRRLQTRLLAPRRSGSAAAETDYLLQVVDAGLALLIFVLPFLLGGRHPIAHFVLVVTAFVIASAWFLRQAKQTDYRWINTAGQWILLASLILLTVQVTPLSEGVRNLLSPKIAELLPAWSAETPAVHSRWQYLSLYPASTQCSLAILLSYALIFLVTVQRIRQPQDAWRLLKWIGGSAAFMASFGLLQYLTSNGKFLWFYEHPFTDTDAHAKGAFSNRNHFAHFLALGFAPLALWYLRASTVSLAEAKESFTSSRGRLQSAQLVQYGLVLGLIVLFLGALLSLSRGGAIALGIAVGLISLVLFREKLLRGQHLLGIVAVGSVVAVALSIHGKEKLSARFDQTQLESLNEIDPGQRRRKIWKANLAIAKDFSLLGTGAGSHADVHQAYVAEHHEFTHAENGYLQIASETGLSGVALLTLSILLAGRMWFRGISRSRSKQLTLMLGAVGASLAASLAHSVVDFVWYAPACMTITVLLLACLTRLYRFTTPQQQQLAGVVTLPRPLWQAATFAIMALGLWIGYDRLLPAIAAPAWVQYQRIVHSDRNADLEQQAGTSEQDQLLRQSMIDCLNRVVQFDSRNARAHLSLARLYVSQFEAAQLQGENVMSLTQVRDAALASNFQSSEQLHSWLQRAVGANTSLLDRALYHTSYGIHLCPLLGEAYIYLAELNFLHGHNNKNQSVFVDQALRVRPHQGSVLLEAGKERILAGKVEEGMAHWKTCFQQGGHYQQQIIQLLAHQVPATFFLETFEPDLTGLRLLHATYRELPHDATGYQKLLTYYASRLTKEAEKSRNNNAGALWLEAHRIYDELGNSIAAKKCAQEALSAANHDFNIRFYLARWYYKQEQYAQAEEHLRWCSQRRPRDESVLELLRSATLKKFSQQNATATRPPSVPIVPDNRHFR